MSLPESQLPAENDAGVECLDAEVHGPVDVAQVRQLDPESGNLVYP